MRTAPTAMVGAVAGSGSSLRRISTARQTVRLPSAVVRDYALLIAVSRIVYALPVASVTVQHAEHPETHDVGVVVRMPRHMGHSRLIETALRRNGYDVETRNTPGAGTAMWVRRAE